MMKNHHVKILPLYFRDVESGIKKFEIRKNDRDYKVGDIVHLEEWDNLIHDYTGKVIVVEITYIIDNPEYCKEGYVVFGFKELCRIRSFKNAT